MQKSLYVLTYGCPLFREPGTFIGSAGAGRRAADGVGMMHELLVMPLGIRRRWLACIVIGRFLGTAALNLNGIRAT